MRPNEPRRYSCGTSAKRCGVSTIMAENQERATSCPAHVLSRRDFSSFLRAGVDKISGQHYRFLGWTSYIRSQELADEMADGWGHLITQFFYCPDATAAFLERASTPDRVDDSNVTSAISPDDVCAALKRLKRRKAAGRLPVERERKETRPWQAT